MKTVKNNKQRLFRWGWTKVASLWCCIWILAVMGQHVGDLRATEPIPAATETISVVRRLQPNDVLEMTVYQEPDLTTKVTLDGRGMAELPLIGSLKLAGLTLSQATATVHDLYDKDYLVNPKVTIQLEQMAIQRFTVLGQVQRPGSFEFPPNESINLLQSIAMSGGYTRLAAPSKVTLQRVVHGSLSVYELDAADMAKDKKNKPFEILPGDIITIGERVF